ncbi:GMP synthase (glutamine-hydrolysing) [Vulcaniibacterium tengchongense]|uniref:GMP synthase (Glutamine-hydrolysing) n=1 Tax=Vulcaniibacterium tengchongense TaxID=1273429 RepID=A0A3N4VEH8_9GAMM|nr:GMP synthase (glutamine-hydrolysing) [Vulcaniibacterium tengchongense]
METAQPASNFAVNLPFLILETGQPVASMRRHRGFPHWIRVAAGLARDEAVAVNVEAGDPLPRRDGFAGVLITGSGAMVTDRADWSERSADWLREAAHDGLPLFGICYGHQLLAHALGGEVGDNPAGREMGTVHVELHPHAGADPLFAGLPPRFPAQATHLQTVLRPPEGATVLARSAQDDCHAFRWGERVWGVQFHPEFSAAHMRGYVRARREALQREGRCAKALAREVSAAPHARRVLRRFVRHARALHAR